MTNRLVEDAFDRQVKTWRWCRGTGHQIVSHLLSPRIARTFGAEFSNGASTEEATRHAQEILVLERMSGYAHTFALAEDIGNAVWAASQGVPNDTVLEREHAFEPLGFVWSESPLKIPYYVSEHAVTSDGFEVRTAPHGTGPFKIPAQGFGWYVVNGDDTALGMSVKTEDGVPLTGVYFLFVGAGEDFADVAGVPRGESSTIGAAQVQYSVFWRFGDSLEKMRKRALSHRDELNLGDEFDTDDDALMRTKFAWAFWRFVGQDILRRSRIPVTRQRQRNVARIGWPGDPTVDVVELRRRRYEPSGMTDDERKEWSCRWLVSGHWRSQWYPSLGVHKTIWVSGYVKGPDDKPLVVKGPRVYSVIR